MRSCNICNLVHVFFLILLHAKIYATALLTEHRKHSSALIAHVKCGVASPRSDHSAVTQDTWSCFVKSGVNPCSQSSQATAGHLTCHGLHSACTDHVTQPRKSPLFLFAVAVFTHLYFLQIRQSAFCFLLTPNLDSFFLKFQTENET